MSRATHRRCLGCLVLPTLALALALNLAAATLVDVPQLGLRLPRGFRVSLFSYAVVFAGYVMTDGKINGPHRHLIFVVGLIVLGSVVAYQVNRVRALSRYYERRPLPR